MVEHDILATCKSTESQSIEPDSLIYNGTYFEAYIDISNTHFGSLHFGTDFQSCHNVDGKRLAFLDYRSFSGSGYTFE